MSKKLAQNVQVGNELFLADSTPPKEIADQITNPKAWGDSADADDQDPADPPTGYRAQSADDLKAEIDKRNEGREDDAKLSKRGGVEKLAAVLDEDDAASDATGE